MEEKNTVTWSKNINAKPGSPSTFWTRDGKLWYRTKKEAEANDASTAVNPDDYVYKKGFFATNWKWIVGGIILLALIGGGFYLYHKGTITFHLHKAA